MKKTYAFAGASSRGIHMFMLPMAGEFAEYCEPKGIFDTNPGRADYASRRTGVKAFRDFGQMLYETKPDVVIVTTVDAFHSDYIIRSLEYGCDVITEKPMTTDAAKCRAILEAERRTGRKVTVTFNYRYAPFATKVKELISGGVVGDVFSVHFEWMLDRNMDVSAHGTSYFRRWNSRMEKSGGLLVHKSTHHFDMINWWLEDVPEKVSAFGKLNLYGTNGSVRYAGGISGENCRKCGHTASCGFYYRLSDLEREMYESNEAYDGYYKDGCVYAPDIDIYDTMSLNVRYGSGAVLSYSLNATCAYEGWRASVNGSKGRLEAFMPETGCEANPNEDAVRFYDLRNDAAVYRVTKAGGDHGGGDSRLRKALFIGGGQDPLRHGAGSRDGASSILIGAAANISIREGKTVDLPELLGDASLWPGESR